MVMMMMVIILTPLCDLGQALHFHWASVSPLMKRYNFSLLPPLRFCDPGKGSGGGRKTFQERKEKSWRKPGKLWLNKQEQRGKLLCGHETMEPPVLKVSVVPGWEGRPCAAGRKVGSQHSPPGADSTPSSPSKSSPANHIYQACPSGNLAQHRHRPTPQRVWSESLKYQVSSLWGRSRC